MVPMKLHTRILLILLTFLLVSCSGEISAAQSPTQPEPAAPTSTVTFTPIPSFTPTATIVPTATLTPTATIIPTATWAVAGPGDVTAPILLYHHVDPENASPRYNVMPEVFAQQMQALDDWGYHTITATQLVEAITEGAPLPERPIVITFDDGHMSVFEYAMPIMQEHGFVGVNYIVANRLEAAGFVGVDELAQMVDAGWEIGSHSYTHSDLSKDHSIATTEIRYSQEKLEEELGVPVKTFAYPFGAFDNYLGGRTSKWGYIAGMGLGKGYIHNEYTLFYLQRIEVMGGVDLQGFAALLPWSAPPE